MSSTIGIAGCEAYGARGVGSNQSLWAGLDKAESAESTTMALTRISRGRVRPVGTGSPSAYSMPPELEAACRENNNR